MFTNILIAIAYFIVKAMSLFMSCDKMIGGQFEKGLALP